MKYTVLSQIILCAIYIKNTVHCTDVNQVININFTQRRKKYDF